MGQVFVDLDGNGLVDPATVKDPRDTGYTCETGRDGGWLVAGRLLVVLRRRRRV